MKATALILISFVLFGCVSTPVDENRLAVSREFAEAIVALPQAQEAINGVLPEMLETVATKTANLSDTQRDKIAALAEAEFNKGIDNLTEHLAQLYAEHFYTNELEELVEIMENFDEDMVLPARQHRLANKFVSKTPLILRKFSVYSSELAEEVSGRLIEQIQRESSI